ncbi:endonuclease [Chitinophaga lutea]|uniref:Endonuclease n=1 Tax=Chitinophaga lutea TaxID=2488634 RepID=A0A3N4QBB7_9BACT|nr:endonuclease/exonuclease/phosphatase family protein [Chitinophaga lutea]RPE13267.1 endonuclease [Chitinophaga lutea]
MKNRLLLLLAVMSAGCTASRQATAQADQVNILCYNIHHANPPSVKDRIDIPAIAKVIAGTAPAIVALQEVDVHTDRSGKELHQAEALAKQFGMQYFFAKGIDYGGGEYGVAILSKYPILETKRYPLTTLPGTNGEPRVLATALLQLPNNKRILMACTHLDAQRSDSNRLVQIKEIMDILKEQRYPVILAGDLNAPNGTPVIDALDRQFTRTCGDCAPTIPVENPRRCIDFVAFTPGRFEVLKHAVIPETYASDHLPVNAVLRLR